MAFAKEEGFNYLGQTGVGANCQAGDTYCNKQSGFDDQPRLFEASGEFPISAELNECREGKTERR